VVREMVRGAGDLRTCSNSLPENQPISSPFAKSAEIPQDFQHQVASASIDHPIFCSFLVGGLPSHRRICERSEQVELSQQKITCSCGAAAKAICKY
jgi:hypothetical protein